MESNIEQLFTKYSGALIFNGLPHKIYAINSDKLRLIIKQKKALFARYFTDSELLSYTPSLPCEHNQQITSMRHQNYDGWYHVVRDTPIFFENLQAKQRYRVKKGKSLNNIYIATVEELNTSFDSIYYMLLESYKDYPKTYKPSDSDVRKFLHSLVESHINGRGNIWLVRDIESDRLIGLSYCSFDEDTIGLKVVKVNPSYLKNEVNAALVYDICQHYINNKGYRYVNDGERNIRHITNYQEFLIRVLGFHKAKCQLHIIYHPILRPAINILYFFRKLILRIGKYNKFIYNVSCVLKQEEIVRNCR